MAFLDKTVLEDLGIELSEQDYESLAVHFDTTLRERVIAEIVEELSVEQAEQLADAQNLDDEQLQAWLTANVPQLGDIVSDQIDILLGELASNADSLNNPPAV